MKLIAWSKDFSVGVDEFDNQHKHLFNMLDNFYSNLLSNNDKVQLSRFIEDMHSFAKEHFDLEEKMMICNQYPKYYEHKKKHRAFIEIISDFMKWHDDEKQLHSVEFTNFMKEWLSHHIMEMDKEYGRFINRNTFKLLG